MKKILECVPNISEGKNQTIINSIANQVKNTQGVKLLHIDSGLDTNRTVITFAGEPNQVVEAAFLIIKKAAELIDMSKQKGKHPRFGATDVCPLVPISGISMEEVKALAHNLSMRVANGLNIPVYAYEQSAKTSNRQSLANCRKGEYEGLKEKLLDPEWKPDYGPTDFNVAKKTGAVAIGARNLLVAYNINLNTTSAEIANKISAEVRESGKIQKINNKTVRIPGSLKYVKAIGWYIKEFGCAQVSMNLTNINETPIYIVFEEIRKKAIEKGVKVTGSELIGLIPLKSLTQAGNYYLQKSRKKKTFSEKEMIDSAIKELGLNDLKPFHPDKRIIEYCLNQ